MRFSQLLTSAGLNAAIRGGQTDITDIQIDSRRCKAGSCFVAVQGWKEDGHKYIPAAIKLGAAAVVCQDPAAVPEGFPCATAEDGQGAAASLAQAVRGWPARKLICAGVTGTNGKTTVTYMIQSILAAVGHRPALLGTIHYDTGSRNEASNATTPGPIELAELTAEMVAAGKTHLVMETSSHAIDQGRIDGLDFQAAVFTNLTGDHLDYHGDMESYLAAKQKLFRRLAPTARAIINRDDPYGQRIAEASRGQIDWYSLSPCDGLWARVERIDEGGTHFMMIAGDKEIPVASPMIGKHNVQNCLAAAGACRALGVSLEDVAAALATISRVPGRLERVAAAAPYSVFVDYAHTDDALVNVLGAMRPVAKGRIILLFGCGGDRDRTKRPRMARVAEQLADCIVVTSDNPRSEQPQAIIDEILTGFSPAGREKAVVELDRHRAIELAIGQARGGDCVLIAGKGHEKYQIIGSQKLDFDDVKVAEQAVCRRELRA